jgi:uncharacterized membrane protein
MIGSRITMNEIFMIGDSRGRTHGSLIVCCTIELLALSIWIGGLVVIVAAVIPAVFNSFGMEPGGRFLTLVFDGYNRLTAAAILILTTASGWRAWQTWREGGGSGRWPAAALPRLELALLSVMILIAVLIIMVLGPESVTLQERAFAVQDEAAKKAAYAAFFQTHTVVRGLYLLNLVLGIVLLAVKARSWIRRSRVEE